MEHLFFFFFTIFLFIMSFWYYDISLNQVLCSLVKVIMTFQASQSFVAISASMILLTSSHFVCPPIFLRCFPLLCFSSIIPVVTRCPVSLISSPGQKRFPGVYLFYLLVILFLLLITPFHLIFVVVHNFRGILQRKHISVASSFFCSCFKIAQALHP